MKSVDVSPDAVRCGTCDQQLFEASDEQREPCSNCGSLVRKFSAQITEELIATDYVGLKHKRQKKPIYEIIHKPNLFRSNDSVSEVLRIIDREKNIYIEKITDVKTGRVWKDVNEPLDEHRGHGSAKVKK